MEIKDLEKKLIAVVGYGIEGKAMATYLLNHGVEPVLFDHKPWDQWLPSEREEIRSLKVNFIFGPDCLKELSGFEVIFRSPGIPRSHPDFIKFSKPSAIFSSQTKWFFEHCKGKIIGVTGTKGKGTTSSLIYEILKLSKTKSNNQKSNVFLTGNIGKIQPLEFLDDLTQNDWIVYELSSFQLQDLNSSPHIGVVLMITSEHLDYHKNVDEYVQAKAAICKFQTNNDSVVINANYESSSKVGLLGNGKKFYFNTQDHTSPLNSLNTSSSADCCVSDDYIFLRGQKFLNISDLQLRGKHNQQNICAAILASSLAGCDDQCIKEVVIQFKGLEHRLEFTIEKNSIKFYNDSFSTTPETAIAAINSFTEPLVLILGGSSKNSDFTELGKTINNAKNIKAIILIGDETDKIKSVIELGKSKVITGAKNMQEIFGHIKSIATSGDVVLLSPACASFGMFKNYKDRGEQFKKAAHNV